MHPNRQPRLIDVPASCEGMRLDRFLAARFTDRSRTSLAAAVRRGEVTEPGGRVLRASASVRSGQSLVVWIEGIAASTGPPPFPPILFEDDRMLVVDKPAGMLAHPTGTAFAWALVSLAKRRWPEREIHIAHRLDRDTSGIQVLAFDADANRALKHSVRDGAHKEYEAITRGVVRWDEASLTDPIGPADGVIRIQMAVRPDGQAARTDVTVLERSAMHTRVRCVLHTGRTHQIRVHLHHAGYPLLGDRMYGVPPEVFLRTLDHGADATVIAAAGAPRQALHARRITIPHPDGREMTFDAPLPDDMRRWFETPDVLPYDGTNLSEAAPEADE